MYTIQFTPEALADLRVLRKHEAQLIVAETETHLSFEPVIATRNRKQLRPNQLAEWELRIKEFRVFYDVRIAEVVVKVIAVGRKSGNRLWIHGKEYQL